MSESITNAVRSGLHPIQPQAFRHPLLSAKCQFPCHRPAAKQHPHQDRSVWLPVRHHGSRSLCCTGRINNCLRDFGGLHGKNHRGYRNRQNGNDGKDLFAIHHSLVCQLCRIGKLIAARSAFLHIGTTKRFGRNGAANKARQQDHRQNIG